MRFLIRIDFKFLSVITFIELNGFQSSSSLCTCICEIMTECWFYTFLTKSNLFTKYRWRTYSRWQIILIPVVSSSGMMYAIMVSVPAEKHM
jgi:cytochrome c oxidase subunit IV